MVYPRQQSNFWYLKRWPYRIFILREFSAVFLAAYMVVLLILVMKVHDGPAAFHDFADTLQSPALIVFNTIALLFALLHTVTWFMAVPSAMQLRRGEEKVPPQLLIGAAYVLMLGASVVVLLLVLV
ncbi:MAG: fumarate reductase subunit [Frankiales bacterium]|jgi:fumarate reductase subunit C|nr:fumarate reductase subunit [Frankiales bacterium]